jgi:hypothetical protein
MESYDYLQFPLRDRALIAAAIFRDAAIGQRDLQFPLRDRDLIAAPTLAQGLAISPQRSRPHCCPSPHKSSPNWI